MARKLSEEKRDSIIEAAITEIAEEGLAVAALRISKSAGIAEGTLFLYFETKDALLNAVFRQLRQEQATATFRRVPTNSDANTVRYVWGEYVRWGLLYPKRYRALNRLEASELVSAATRAVALEPFGDLIAALERLAHPDLAPVPEFAGRLVVAMAEVTINEIQQNPASREELLEAGIAAMWRAWAGL